MRSLRNVQQQFAAAILDGDDAILPALLDDRLGAARRLNVYRNNTQLTLRAALAAIYPAIERLVGADFFSLCAREYLHAHPSSSGDVNDYGAHFAAFLKTFAPARELAYLPDVARLEWAYHRAFHAADAAPLDMQRLAVIPAELHGELHFVLHPSARVISSRYPIFKIWRANQPDAESDVTIDLDGGGESVLVYRPKLDVALVSLSVGESAFLDALIRKTTFEQACDVALAADTGFDLQTYFAGCVEHHVVTDFHPETYPSPLPSPTRGEGEKHSLRSKRPFSANPLSPCGTNSPGANLVAEGARRGPGRMPGN